MTKNLKKRVLALLLTLAMAVSLAACGGSGSGGSSGGSSDSSSSSSSDSGSSGAKTTVHVWAGGSDNVRQMFERLVEAFNNDPEYNKGKFHAELQFILSGTGGQTLPDLLISTYKANQTNTDFDVVELGLGDLSKIISLIGLDGFNVLDKSQIPNSAGVSAKPAVAEEYMQPYRGTTVVLAYNSDTVTDVPTTTDELYQWIKDHPGRFAYNTPGTGGAGDSFARTTIYNYIDEEAITSDDPKWEAFWDEGFAKLQELHPYMYKTGGKIVYPNKNQGTLDLLGQGEIDMCPNWADMVLSQRAAGTLPSSIKLTSITPSFTGEVVSFSIPKFGSTSEGGYAFIYFMLSPYTQEILVKQMAAIPLVDVSGMDMTGYEDLQNLDVSNFRTLSIGSLDTDFNERWDTEVGIIG